MLALLLEFRQKGDQIMSTLVDLSLTDQQLNRLLDQVKKDVFLGKNAAFLGSIMCSLDFFWDRTPEWINKVGTDGQRLLWGVQDFLECDQVERASTAVHEFWHPARLHFLRRGERDPELWNIACDYRINNDMRADGYHIPNTWCVNPDIDRNGILAEEEIYDLLVQKALQIPAQSGMSGDMRPDPNPSPHKQTQMISAVVRAVQAAKMAGQAGSLPGQLKEILDSFLEPVVPWRNVLAQWATDLLDSAEWTWKRPNRRFQSIYLPSLELEEGRLKHLMYAWDVSGSVTKQNAIRFNSEVKYIQEVLQPDRLTLIQFDTKIQDIRVFEQGEPFDGIEIVGRGGTSLRCIHDWIETNKPTAAIIFSDLECTPMQPLSVDIPTIWAVIRNKNVYVDFGKVIYVDD